MIRFEDKWTNALHIGAHISRPPKWNILYSNSGDLKQTNGSSCGIFTAMILYMFMINGIWPSHSNSTTEDILSARQYMFYSIYCWKQEQDSEGKDCLNAIDSVTQYIKHYMEKETSRPDCYILNDNDDG